MGYLQEGRGSFSQCQFRRCSGSLVACFTADEDGTKVWIKQNEHIFRGYLSYEIASFFEDPSLPKYSVGKLNFSNLEGKGLDPRSLTEDDEDTVVLPRFLDSELDKDCDDLDRSTSKHSTFDKSSLFMFTIDCEEALLGEPFEDGGSFFIDKDRDCTKEFQRMFLSSIITGQFDASHENLPASPRGSSARKSAAPSPTGVPRYIDRDLGLACSHLQLLLETSEVVGSFHDQRLVLRRPNGTLYLYDELTDDSIKKITDFLMAFEAIKDNTCEKFHQDKTHEAAIPRKTERIFAEIRRKIHAMVKVIEDKESKGEKTTSMDLFKAAYSLSGNLFELLIEANPTKPSFGFHYLQRACAADGYPYASIFEDLRREYRGNAEFYQKLDEIEKNYREILEEQPAEVFP